MPFLWPSNPIPGHTFQRNAYWALQGILLFIIICSLFSTKGLCTSNYMEMDSIWFSVLAFRWLYFSASCQAWPHDLLWLVKQEWKWCVPIWAELEMLFLVPSSSLALFPLSGIGLVPNEGCFFRLDLGRKCMEQDFLSRACFPQLQHVA